MPRFLLCDWCGESLRELTYTNDPVWFRGKSEHICIDCLDAFMLIVEEKGYHTATTIINYIVAQRIHALTGRIV